MVYVWVNGSTRFINHVRTADEQRIDRPDRFDVLAGDVVRTTRPPHGITLLHPPGYSYFAMLREKLHWSSTPRY